MAEQHDRCRYWPRCAVHLGEPRPRDMAPSVIKAIRAQHAAGAKVGDIAAEWGLQHQTVSTLVRRVTYRNVA